ncbi:MAG: 50S ribosomal protein L29 [Deltaproteobacteria bacterium]|nr:50S ribosomal protein L29 [Deltaproteobacteria bacterium]
MKINELKDLSVDELKDKHKGLQEQLFNFRFQHSTNQLENPMRLRHTKKDIARVLTVINEKGQAKS